MNQKNYKYDDFEYLIPTGTLKAERLKYPEYNQIKYNYYRGRGQPQKRPAHVDDYDAENDDYDGENDD